MSEQVQRFTELADRLARLKERRAVLVSKEEEKRKERVKLEAELQAMGVDPTKLDEEEARLTKELDDLYQKSKVEVDEFEKKLQESGA